VNFCWKIARARAELVLEVLLRLLVKFQAESYIFIVLLVDRVGLNGSGECDGEGDGQKTVAHGIWGVGGFTQFFFKFGGR
jgi:hypothetical protein